jgi:hypothetical protein
MHNKSEYIDGSLKRKRRLLDISKCNRITSQQTLWKRLRSVTSFQFKKQDWRTNVLFGGRIYFICLFMKLLHKLGSKKEKLLSLPMYHNHGPGTGSTACLKMQLLSARTIIFNIVFFSPPLASSHIEEKLQITIALVSDTKL